jgi:hypothetical protein
MVLIKFGTALRVAYYLQGVPCKDSPVIIVYDLLSIMYKTAYDGDKYVLTRCPVLSKDNFLLR